LSPKAPSDPLERYRGKRDFTRTSEPKPSIQIDEGSRFVIQKHAARRLHYDLRLELDGVLLSWAVPQGPSLVVTDKRLAVRTEDHPLKYLEFEGAIPRGQYGAGTMIVWDRGEWTPIHDPHKSLAKGHLEFELRGQRLHGRWHLVRMKPRPREKTEPWLLIKATDEYARPASSPNILEEEVTSVLSGRANADLNEPEAIREDHKRRSEIVAARLVKLPELLKIKGARKGLLRLFVEPSLASPAERPPKGEQWRHEIKFDGYRMQARIDGDEVRLLTRKGLDWTERFASVAEALRELNLGSAILDGEVVVEDSAGISNFAELVRDLKAGRQDRFRYYAFDLLYLSGVDLTGAELADRKEILARVLASSPQSGKVALSEHFSIEGARFFEHISRLGLEGMISKRRDAPYRSGRTKDWLKSRCVLSQEFVVVGYVPSTTARHVVGSLVLGFYEKDGLALAGRAGSGFTEEAAKALFQALEPTRTKASPLDRKPPAEAAKGVQWVEPRLIAQVDHHGWTSDGLLWHATFRGLRDDKDIREIIRENPDAAAKEARRPFSLTHPERMLWPDDGVTKQGLADYYVGSANWIIPHLIGRPLSLVRCPNGVAADCFFAKHAWAGLSDVVRRVSIGKEAQALAIEDVEGLLSLVQGNVLEIHPWGSSLSELERPDRLIFDLDPGEEVAWGAVIEAAVEVRARLFSTFKLESFVKTTGGKGLHVIVPMIPSMEWERAKALCKGVADAMAADSPHRYVEHMAKGARKGRVFVDYLRNGRGATAVAAYSTRARPGATISTPLDWSELSEAVKSDHFRFSNIGRRLDNLRRDPWEGFFEIRQAASIVERRRKPARAESKVGRPKERAGSRRP
jgi:bifunctional non-homologous end joining protein LigD